MELNETSGNNHSIPLDRAIEMVKLYRDNREKILTEEYRGQDILPLSETFNRDAFNSFFANPEVRAIRIHYGMSENLQTHAIIVGVNDKNEDILPSESLVTDLPDAVILEEGTRCPPICPTDPPLNGL